MLFALMTPSLAAVYDELVAHAASSSFAERVGRVRAAFVHAVGPFAPTDPWFEERSAALWDRVLTSPGFAAAMRATPASSFSRDHFGSLDAIARAQRGLFELHRARSGDVDLLCVVRGAAFRIGKTDDLQNRLLGRTEQTAPGLLDAFVAPCPEGIAILPGVLMHSAEATGPIREILAKVGERQTDPLLDALLAMRHRLQTRSRMRASQVYRFDSLGVAG
jgi:hypothetical protein